MSDQKTYSIQEFRGLLAEHLRKEMREWEDVLLTLRKRELAKDDSHYEPGNHETPDTGVAPHMEPGQHEQHAFGPGGLAAQHAPDPIGSATGVPMNGQPPDSTPGGEVCPMCNQPDLPGSCQCLGGTAPAGGGDVDGFDRPDADLGADAGLGGGDLRMSEQSLAKAQKRKVTAHQVRAMATKKGEDDGRKEYSCERHEWYGTELSPNKLTRPAPCPKCKAEKSKKVEKNASIGYGDGASAPVSSGSSDMNAGQGDISGTSLAQSEMTHVCNAPLCTKGIKGDATYCKAHKPKKDEKPMKKDLASATADLKSKNKMLDNANKVRATKPMFQTKFSKEEWIDIANEGDPVKRLTNYPSNANETAVPASTDNKGAVKRGQGVDIKTVPGATSEKYPVTKGVKKAEVPMAKPPSGQNMGTAVPKAKVQAPKLPAAPKPMAPKLAAAPKLPGMGKSGMPWGGAGIKAGSGTPAGVVKSQELEKGRIGKLGGALLAGSLLTAAAVKPAADHAKAKVAEHMKKPAVAAQKAEMPAHKQMAMQANSDAHKAHLSQGAPSATPAVKLPGMAEQDQRAQMYADFMPKPAGPSVPGLKAPPATMMAPKPAAPKLPGMGKPAAKPIFGKGEMEDLKCSMCKGSEHAGECK